MFGQRELRLSSRRGYCVDQERADFSYSRRILWCQRYRLLQVSLPRCSLTHRRTDLLQCVASSSNIFRKFAFSQFAIHRAPSQILIADNDLERAGNTGASITKSLLGSFGYGLLKYVSLIRLWLSPRG